MRQLIRRILQAVLQSMTSESDRRNPQFADMMCVGDISGVGFALEQLDRCSPQTSSIGPGRTDKGYGI